MAGAFSEAYNVITVGALGAGKSALINMLVDPSGQREVTREGNREPLKGPNRENVRKIQKNIG